MCVLLTWLRLHGQRPGPLDVRPDFHEHDSISIVFIFLFVFIASLQVSFHGSWSSYPYFASGNVIVNSIERGLFVLRPNHETIKKLQADAKLKREAIAN